jgi:uracil-DNA glycosylase family 4
MTANRPLNDAEFLSALEWYRAAGVDFAMGEEPVDRFAASQAAPRAKAAERVAPAAAQLALPAQAPLTADPSEARALAASAQSLEQLQALMNAYDGCSLKLRATQLVFFDGNPEAKIMLVGEAPGAEEDRVGKPFVGKAGQLLDRVLGAIGLDRTKVYICNTVPWRPPGNRNPTPQEMAACQPFLFRQIELVAPRILLTVGAVSSQSLFETSVGITRLRGQWRELTIGSHTMQAVATLHPAYLLRTPSAKAQVWKDMLSLKQMMRQQGLE